MTDEPIPPMLAANVQRPDFLQQRFINRAHQRFVSMLQEEKRKKLRADRRTETEPERIRRKEQSRHDRIASRRK